MTAAELRRVVEAMTCRPWHLSDTHPEFGSSRDHSVFDTYGNVNDGPNAAAIVTLANYADALVALVEACEALDDAYDRGVGASLMSERLRGVRLSLAAVHAIRSKV